MNQSSQQSDSGGRTEVVKSYVSQQTLEDLDREADRRGCSRSSLVDEYIRRGLRHDREDEVAAEARAVRKLQDVLDQGLDDFRETARHQQDLNAKTGVYAVAAFELLKDNHGQAQVKDALETASRRLRDDELDVDDVASNLDDKPDDGDDGGFWDD